MCVFSCFNSKDDSKDSDEVCSPSRDVINNINIMYFYKRKIFIDRSVDNMNAKHLHINFYKFLKKN